MSDSDALTRWLRDEHHRALIVGVTGEASARTYDRVTLIHLDHVPMLESHD